MINTEQILRTLRIISVPICDPTARKMCKQLREMGRARSTFIVLISDTDIKNWCGALAKYIVPINDHFPFNDSPTLSPHESVERIGPVYDILPNTKPVSLMNTGLRDSCELIKTMISESISTTCFPLLASNEQRSNNDQNTTVHGQKPLANHVL